MPNDRQGELALVARARAGDRDAVAALWDAHTSALHGYLLHVLRDRDRAEELVSRTWIRVLEGLASYGGRSSFRSWLIAIARNECRQDWRRSGREVALDPERHDIPSPDRGDARDAHLDVERALARLTDDDRELLRLRYLADLPTNDIARILGASAVAVRVRIHRALHRARRAIT